MPDNNDNGFFLLEIMICVSIIALIVVSVFRMQASTIELATAGKFNTLAPILANQVLTKMEPDLESWSEFKGNFGENFRGIEWTCEILDSSFGDLDFIKEEDLEKFKKIIIKITGQGRSYKISTWRFARDE